MVSTNSHIVIVSNRLPVERVKRKGGNRWQISPGGLVSALTPVLKEQPSTWVGWTGVAGPAPKPFEHNGIQICPVALSRNQVKNFYDGFCNGTLWPLYHDAVRTPAYYRRWWRSYVEVNQLYANAAAEKVAENGLVWVHDYQLQLVPAMIRELRPNARIGFYLHIPLPPQELFAQLPWRCQILEGLLGADLVGFQTRIGAANFIRLCKRYTQAPGTGDTLSFRGRNVHIGAYPISIDVDLYEQMASSEQVICRRNTFVSQLSGDRKILLGVDRLDYTKGIDIRLRMFQELLRSGRVNPQDCLLIQIAVPSRERLSEYQRIQSDVAHLVGEINGEFGELGRVPVHYMHRSLSIERLVSLYRAADVMLVTPLRDGMNLVAKEYVASRIDHRGVLVLSEFTGAAVELRSALLVNPHDLDGLIATTERAIQMPQQEQTRRMRALRRTIKRNDVFHWADTYLKTLTA